MKKFFPIFFSFSMTFICKLAISQCQTCDIALAKDYFKENQTIDSRLALLSMVNQDNYEQIKNDHSFSWQSGGDYAEIFSGFFNGSDEWHDFEEKRQKVFKLFSYESSMSEISQEEKLVTNPISYTYWSKCITDCYENQHTRAYGLISSADSNHVNLIVKYFVSADDGITSKPFLKCRIQITNAKILKEGNEGKGEIYIHTQNFTLKRNENRLFTIFREAGKNSCSIQTSTIDGNNIFNENIGFATVDDNYANVTYTLIDQRDSFLRHESNEVTCPNTAPAHAYDNVIYLQRLPVNFFYGNFSNLSCSGLHEDACQFNRVQGLNPRITKSEDLRSASITFTTHSLPCTYTWAADVYEKYGTNYTFSKKIPITGKHFTLRIPTKAVSAVIEISIKKETFLVIPGQDDVKKTVSFIQKSTDGTSDVYSYVLN